MKDLLLAPDADRGGLMLFTLPNGFNGYYIAESVPAKDGKRLTRLAASAPPAWVADRNAPDRIARNGLSCMRCHESGVEPFADAARDALDGLPADQKNPRLKFFPGKGAIDQLLAGDAARVQAAVTAAHGRPLDREPLTPVTTRFLREAQAGPVAPAVSAAARGLPSSPRTRTCRTRPASPPRTSTPRRCRRWTV